MTKIITAMARALLAYSFDDNADAGGSNAAIVELRTSISGYVERMTEIDNENAGAELEEGSEARTEWDQLEADLERDEALLERLETRAKRIADARARGDITGSDAGDTAPPRPGTGEGARTTPFDRIAEVSRFDPAGGRKLRDLAFEALERHIEFDTDAHRDEVDRKLRRLDHDGVLATRMLLTGHPDYASAWGKLLTGRTQMMTADEQRAVERAMAVGTDGAGGYAVPTHLDPTIVIAADGSSNAVRQAAAVETLIEGNTWNGVNTAGVTASFDAEAAEVGDDSPTLAQPSIDVEMARAFIPASIEATQDIAGLSASLLGIFADARDTLEETKFTLGAGSGSNEPHGVVQALVDDGTELLSSAGADTFAVGDVYATMAATGKRYRGPGAAWMGEIEILNDIRQFGSSLGHAFTQDLASGELAQVLGRRVLENTAMDGTYGSGENYVLLFGDFQRGYQIVDKIGLTIEYIPHLFATGNNRPSGQRGWFAYWRTGGGLLTAKAFTLLNVT